MDVVTAGSRSRPLLRLLVLLGLGHPILVARDQSPLVLGGSLPRESSVESVFIPSPVRRWEPYSSTSPSKPSSVSMLGIGWLVANLAALPHVRLPSSSSSSEVVAVRALHCGRLVSHSSLQLLLSVVCAAATVPPWVASHRFEQTLVLWLPVVLQYVHLSWVASTTQSLLMCESEPHLYHLSLNSSGILFLFCFC